MEAGFSISHFGGTDWNLELCPGNRDVCLHPEGGCHVYICGHWQCVPQKCQHLQFTGCFCLFFDTLGSRNNKGYWVSALLCSSLIDCSYSTFVVQASLY